jgi:hypothetical protein
MCPAGYPEKHTPRLHHRHKRDQPVPLLSRFQVPVQTLTPSLPHLRPGLKVVLRPQPIPRLQSVGPERAGAHDKRVTSLPAPISKYVLGIISLWLDQGPWNGWSLIDMGRENSATKLCPVAMGHNLLHPPIPIPHPCPVTISFPAFQFEIYDYNNHLLWVMTGYPRYR